MPASASSSRVRRAAAFALLTVVQAFGAPPAPTQEAKITAADAADSDQFGYSVAVAGDTAIVGAVHHDSYQGAAYVFRRTGTTWTQEAKLTAGDAGGEDHFGVAVAVAGDSAVVGADYKSLARGAAYVFTRSGEIWTQQAKLTPADAASGDWFGTSVAVAGDTVVVGAHGYGQTQGAAYVFTRTGTAWTQEAKLAAADGAVNDQFGGSVAFDGDSAVVGAFNNAGVPGAAYVFERSGVMWTQVAKLTAAVAAADEAFGYSVAIAGDTAVVGASNRNLGQGAVDVFARTESTWARVAELAVAGAANGDGLGLSVAISGGAVLAGAPGRNSQKGAAYVFVRMGTTWLAPAELTIPDAVGYDGVGVAVAISGGTAFVGAPGQDSGRGAAYIFSVVGAPPAGCMLPTNVKAKANAKHPERSTLTASGTLDTGTRAPDFSGAAAFDVGGFHLDVPAFVAKGKSLSYAAGGVSLTIAPAKSASSRATFTVKVTGDLTGRVARDGPLAFHFTNAAHDLSGTANLEAGVLAPHGVTEPALAVMSASATLKGGGRDALKVTLAFATDGVVPAAAEDLSIGFGGTYTSALLPATSFVRKGDAYVLAAKAPGITKATVDYTKGTIAIAGAGLDLGPFAEGGNDVVVTVTRGGDTRTVAVRMSRAGSKLAY